MLVCVRTVPCVNPYLTSRKRECVGQQKPMNNRRALGMLTPGPDMNEGSFRGGTGRHIHTCDHGFSIRSWKVKVRLSENETQPRYSVTKQSLVDILHEWSCMSSSSGTAQHRRFRGTGALWVMSRNGVMASPMEVNYSR